MSQKSDFSYDVIRPEDLLCLKFEFFNLRKRHFKNGISVLESINSRLDSYVTVEFQSQHITEEVFGKSPLPQKNDEIVKVSLPLYLLNNKQFTIQDVISTFEDTIKDPVKKSIKDLINGLFNSDVESPPINALISGPSRLVFRIPKKIRKIPFTMESLLNWNRWEMVLPANALPPLSSESSTKLKRKSKSSDKQKYRKLLPHVAKAISAHTGNTVSINLSILDTIFQDEKIKNQTEVNASHIVPMLLELIPKKPTKLQTAIEAPYRIILSPNKTSTWSHNIFPDKKTTYSELWHTRLVPKDKEYIRMYDKLKDRQQTVRAVWSPDYSLKSNKKKDDSQIFPMPLTPSHRHQIVSLSSDFITVPDDIRRPIKVNDLMLSSLGSWLDIQGQWPLRKGDGFSLSNWINKTVQGRDNFVLTVDEGYLYPTGHEAAIATIHYRTFKPLPNKIPSKINKNIQKPIKSLFESIVQTSNTISSSVSANVSDNLAQMYEEVFSTKLVSYMRRQQFLIVREPVKEHHTWWYSKKNFDIEGKWAFKRTEIEPTITLIDSKNDSSMFIPRIGETPLEFQIKATDLCDAQINLSEPLLFIPGDKAHEDLDISNDDKKILKEWNLAGQKVCYDEKEGSKDNCTFDTDIIKVSHAISHNKNVFSDPFYPVIENCDITDDIQRQFGGDDQEKFVTVHFAEEYIKDKDGFGPQNKHELIFKLKEKKKIDFEKQGTDKVGGIAAPNFELDGISRKYGIVGNMTGNSDFIDVKQFFGDSAPKLLGGISLKEILCDITAKDVPRYTNHTDYQNGIVTTKLEWRTSNLKDVSFFKKGDNSRLHLTSEFVKSIASDSSKQHPDSRYLMRGTLTEFAFVFNDIISIKFRKFEFSKKSGQKPDVDVIIDGVEFLGDLEFLRELGDFISRAGFSDPPAIEVTSSEIRAGYSLGIPSIALGVFSFQNINLGAMLTIPFNGKAASARFDFSKKMDKFLVSVGPFAGEGFLGIVVSSQGVEKIEAAIGFGGNLSLNLGVAQGSVSVTGGLCFTLEHKDEEGPSVTLGGYLDCYGVLNVLGLISISTRFYMQLQYITDEKKVYGRAEVSVSFKVVLIRKTIKLTMERSFARSPPATFADVMPELDNWKDYCEAFASD